MFLIRSLLAFALFFRVLRDKGLDWRRAMLCGAAAIRDYGRACVHDFRFPLRNAGDFVIPMDADSSRDSTYVPALLSVFPAGSALALGSRYSTGCS